MKKINSAGILFICKDKCLLAHSTSARRDSSWMPPKGHVEEGESIEHAAIREVEEEIGWSIKGAFLKDYFDVEYTDSKGRIYKTVRCFIVRIENEDPNKNGPMLKQIGGLQLEEVDQIKWCTKEDVDTLALYRWKEPILKVLKQHLKPSNNS